MSFELDEKQEEKFEEWRVKHKCKNKNKREMTYCFTPIGIGTIVVVKCSCGKEINLTDVEEW